MLFDRILVGVDGSQEGFVALAQARDLLADGGELIAAVICQERLAIHAGIEAPRLAHELHAEAEATVRRARAELGETPRARVELLHGRPVETLLSLAQSSETGLIVVGSHSQHRAAGIVLGSVATAILHEAPEAVLIARAAGQPERFPSRIVIGADGSRASADAARTGLELAKRFGADVSVLVAEGGKELDTVGLAAIGDLEWDTRPPVDALVAAAADADLLVIGSRGLHGVAALGSVSERVAHRARCSVLVVRHATVKAGLPMPDEVSAG